MKCGYSLSVGNDWKSVAKLPVKVHFHCCCLLRFNRLPVAYNNYVLTQKYVAVLINSWKLIQANTGAIGVKGKT